MYLYNSRKSSPPFPARICEPRRKVFIKRKRARLVKKKKKKKAFPSVAGDSYLRDAAAAGSGLLCARVRAHCCPPVTARRSPINRRRTKTPAARSRSNIDGPPGSRTMGPCAGSCTFYFSSRKTVFNQTACQTHVIR